MAVSSDLSNLGHASVCQRIGTFACHPTLLCPNDPEAIQRLRESKSPTNHLTYFGGRICPIPLFRLRVPRQWAAWPRSTLTSSHFPNPHPHPHPSGSFPTPAVLRKNIKADLLEDYKVHSTCSAPRISSMHLVRCPKPDSSSLS